MESRDWHFCLQGNSSRIEQDWHVHTHSLGVCQASGEVGGEEARVTVGMETAPCPSPRFSLAQVSIIFDF